MNTLQIIDYYYTFIADEYLKGYQPISLLFCILFL
jgi:hypothetical protein